MTRFALLPPRRICNSTIPSGAVPSGSGDLCFPSDALCRAGTCGGAACRADPSRCSTGPAARTGNTFVCPARLAANALPTGAGLLCYNSKSACESGSNGCKNGFACTQEYGVCSTGAAGSDQSYSWRDLAPPRVLSHMPQRRHRALHRLTTILSGRAPFWQVLPPRHPHRRPSDWRRPPLVRCISAAMLLSHLGLTTSRKSEAPSCAAALRPSPPCSYDSSYDCLNGPNACTAKNPCVQDLSSCTSGISGAFSMGNVADDANITTTLKTSWMCPSDVPPLALPNGAQWLWANPAASLAAITCRSTGVARSR